MPAPAFVALLALASALPPATAPSSRPPRPALVVLVTVDQLSAAYLERYGHELDGGLARLLDSGAVFTRAFHDHAITETAPGHAVLLSGRFPVHTGITSNRFGVDDPDMPLLHGGGAGASPRRFRGTTLADWLRSRDDGSRVLSVSMKDRAAILPVGRSRQAVFWMAADGEFTTSAYYADSLPAWLRRFNARQMPRRAAGTSWSLLRPEAAYAEPDTVPWEAGRGPDNVFPHPVPDDSAAAANYVRATPMLDEITLALALDGLTAMHLGEGRATDVLAISLSATDVIGHRYGPDSREAHDNVLRLDRSLGRFLDSLFVLRSPSRVAVALTADHGIGSFPELRPGFGQPGGPMHVTLDTVMGSLRASLAARGITRDVAFLENGALLVDRQTLDSARVSPDSVAGEFVRLASGQPGVLHAASLAALARSDTIADVAARRWLHMFAPGGAAVAAVTLTPGSVWGTRAAAEHGTPHDYDAHVPLILLGPWFRPGRYTAPVRVVDLAPTLAEVAGVTPSERVDGRVLREALEGTGRREP